MNTYTVNVECSNCDHSGQTQIEKGKPVPDVIECPNCGCATAKKRAKYVLPNTETKPWWPQWPHSPVIYGPGPDCARTHLSGVMIN